MDKRSFLTAGAAAAALPLRAGPAAPGVRSGPGLLTLSGAIGRANRGPMDPALDQLLFKHGARFDRAWEFDAAMLSRLPSVTIRTTLEYDARPHWLSGPNLGAVVEVAGVAPGAPVSLALRAIDGYTVALSLADAQAYRMIVATALDGVPMSLGGLGPQWAVYDADHLSAFKDKPLKERFGLCPWGLYFIEVKPL